MNINSTHPLIVSKIQLISAQAIVVQPSTPETKSLEGWSCARVARTCQMADGRSAGNGTWRTPRVTPDIGGFEDYGEMAGSVVIVNAIVFGGHVRTQPPVPD
jgi:hypothetical protein